MTRDSSPPDDHKVSVARNPKATHDYHILETWECGIVLTGTEVKSLRTGKASIKEAYARLRNGEVFLDGMNITPYEQGNRYNHDPVRTRKLLLHRREIEKLDRRRGAAGPHARTARALLPARARQAGRSRSAAARSSTTSAKI